MRANMGYTAAQVLKTPVTSGQVAPSARFFFVHGVSYGRECDGYKTRKGKKSARLVTGFELLPTPAQNGVFSLNQEPIMAKAKRGAPAPARTTHKTDFFSTNPEGQALFSVRPGVPLDDALPIAACLLSAAEEVAAAAAQSGNQQLLWATHYLTCMAGAIVNAAADRAQEAAFFAQKEAKHV